MRYYFKQFIKNEFHDSSDAFAFILWAVYKNLTKVSRLSNSVKEELSKLDLSNVDFTSQKEKASRILEKIKLQSKGNTNSYSTMKSIQIKNFKAFGTLNSEDNGIYIELDDKKNIFYAPNGGGKTSFCEAFEYKLTNDLKEAKRRNTTVKDYIKRGKQREQIDIKFKSLINLDSISAYDKNFFQKCFFEKNRIQEFSLLGSKDTGSRERDIIAIVLGLQDLDELVASFVQPKSFKLEELLRNEASSKLNNLTEINKDNIVKKDLYEKEIEIILEKAKCLYPDDKIGAEFLNSKRLEKEKNIENLEKEIKGIEHQNLIIQKSEDIEKIVRIITRKLKRVEKFRNVLLEQTNEINYKSFYEALLNIKDDHNDKRCPACDTLIENVDINPFEKANAEIIKLTELSQAQEKYFICENVLLDVWYPKITNSIKIYKDNVANYSTLKSEKIDQFIDELRNQIKVAPNDKSNKLKFVEKATNYYLTTKQEITDYIENVIQLKKDLNRKNNLIIDKNNDITRLKNEVQTLVTHISNLKKYTKDKFDVVKDLEKFENESAIIKSIIHVENQYNGFVKEVESTYKTFFDSLVNYKLEIERLQIKLIEDKVLQYYLSINKDDSDHESISKISFKLSGENYRIILTLKETDQEIDAYSYFSEGHLRSLGLAVMMAVAEGNKLPFIVFDDVVNAIDSDHRANIIEMMFENDYLSDTQLIITTHDRLFWERFCNTYGVQVDNKKKNKISYLFSYTNIGSIAIQYDIGFEEKIKHALNNFDIRQALVYCRIWFETIAIEYCVTNRKELRGNFSRDTKSNLLKPSLESIYGILCNDFPSSSCLNIIKKDLVNWSGQNQEHHSFDEQSYNFIHSKNSNEISVIFEAIRELVLILYPEREFPKLTKRKINLENSVQSALYKLNNPNFVTNAPQHVVEELRSKMEDSLSEIPKIESLLLKLHRVD